jgi:hypothetical protein
LAAFALPLLLVVNAMILGQSAIYPVFFIGQIAFYALAFKGYLNVRKGGEGGVGSVPFYFSLMNYAVFAGFGRWLGRRQSAVWERAQRKEG